jgi:transcriptional regulator with XRE-family HTH domain
LGIELKQSAARAKLTIAELARRADVNPSWLRQVAAGGIKKPGSARLRAIAEHIDLDYSRMLALTDQLGEATVPPPASEIGRLIEAVNNLVTEMRLHRERDQDAAQAMMDAAQAILEAQRLGEAPASKERGVPDGSVG